jgi:hypothetical protein
VEKWKVGGIYTADDFDSDGKNGSHKMLLYYLRHAKNFSKNVNYRPNLMRSISGWDDYKISFVCLFVCFSVTLLCPQISSNYDQTWYVGSERQGKGRVRVWYKSDINFRFYAAILDFGKFEHFG